MKKWQKFSKCHSNKIEGGGSYTPKSPLEDAFIMYLISILSLFPYLWHGYQKQLQNKS